MGFVLWNKEILTSCPCTVGCLGKRRTYTSRGYGSYSLLHQSNAQARNPLLQEIRYRRCLLNMRSCRQEFPLALCIDSPPSGSRIWDPLLERFWAIWRMCREKDAALRIWRHISRVSSLKSSKIVLLVQSSLIWARSLTSLRFWALIRGNKLYLKELSNANISLCNTSRERR